jgi:hypothetical protein
LLYLKYLHGIHCNSSFEGEAQEDDIAEDVVVALLSNIVIVVVVFAITTRICT